MLDAKFVFLGAALNVVGAAKYAVDTVRGRNQPNRVTWLLWAVAPMIAFSAQLSEGVAIRSLTTLMVGLGPAAVFASSFVNPRAYWRLTSFDLLCGALSLVALAGWITSRSGQVAIALSILADALAAVPTVVKAYKRPETEGKLLYMCASLSAGITLLTIDEWSVEYWAFPAYILVLCASLFLLLMRPNASRSPANP